MRMAKKSRTTSFSLGDELSAFIRSQVNSGAYGSASEVVRDALLRLADEQRKEANVLAALDEGLASGRARADVFARARRRVNRS
jgi:antitoxin ParD1/3/4